MNSTIDLDHTFMINTNREEILSSPVPRTIRDTRSNFIAVLRLSYGLLVMEIKGRNLASQ